MPDMHVVVRWPDDSVMRYYSPSLIIRDYLEIGGAYSLADFVERSRTALGIGSERIRIRYGYPCSRAADALERIELSARSFLHHGIVRIEAYDDA